MMGFKRQSLAPASAVTASAATALDAKNDRAAVYRVEPSESMRILVVDDNPDNLTLICRVLGALGHTPLTAVTAVTAAEGLEMARRERPDLVLLDIVLPGMDGHQVMRLMKAAPELAGTPIVALTALTTPGHPTRALQAGFDDYLQKPIDLRRLVDVIGKCAARNSGSNRPSHAATG